MFAFIEMGNDRVSPELSEACTEVFPRYNRVKETNARGNVELFMIDNQPELR